MENKSFRKENNRKQGEVIVQKKKTKLVRKEAELFGKENELYRKENELYRK